MPFSALPSQSLSSHCLSFSFSPLLLDLTKTTHELPSRHSAPPKVKPNSTENKKNRPSNFTKNLHLGWTLDFHIFTVWTEVNPLGSGGGQDGLTCWDAEEKKKKRREKIMHHTSSFLGERREGERKSVRQTEFLILWDDVSKCISFGATAASVYILHTHSVWVLWTDCEPALRLPSFRLLSTNYIRL